MLCGGMFGLRSYRHRHFECSFPVDQPEHPKHVQRVNRRGENRREHWANGGFITITGDVGTYCGPEAMGIKWMNGNEMSEAIPPAYSEFIAKAFLASAKRPDEERQRRDTAPPLARQGHDTNLLPPLAPRAFPEPAMEVLEALAQVRIAS